MAAHDCHAALVSSTWYPVTLAVYLRMVLTLTSIMMVQLSVKSMIMWSMGEFYSVMLTINIPLQQDSVPAAL